jgi:atrial natriuretic peptide receptor A
MIVREKTQSIVEETEKTEQLIHQLLPPFIASELKLGKHIAPESFDSVTICFSDVIGFKEETNAASPEQAVDLLNDVYAAIDTIIANYDVYKVETIADNYLIASGVPVRNGNEHARHVARMALDLRLAMKNFKPRYETKNKLQIRIGINSGSCVTGVVGMKLPKYCLFGDTINTASRMQTNGEPGKIHVSQITKSILELFGNFILIPRGEVEIKGKGKVRTFWLEGEERSYK